MGREADDASPPSSAVTRLKSIAKRTPEVSHWHTISTVIKHSFSCCISKRGGGRDLNCISTRECMQIDKVVSYSSQVILSWSPDGYSDVLYNAVNL